MAKALKLDPPLFVLSIEARSGERRHTRTMNRVHDSPFEWCIDLSLPVVSQFLPRQRARIATFNEIKDLADGFMERVRPRAKQHTACMYFALGNAACKQAQAAATSEAGGSSTRIGLRATVRSLYWLRGSCDFAERDLGFAEHWILEPCVEAMRWHAGFLFTAQRRLDAES